MYGEARRAELYIFSELYCPRSLSHLMQKGTKIKYIQDTGLWNPLVSGFYKFHCVISGFGLNSFFALTSFKLRRIPANFRGTEARCVDGAQLRSGHIRTQRCPN